MLDIGCGVTTTAIEVARRFAATVTAADISPLMLAHRPGPRAVNPMTTPDPTNQKTPVTRQRRATRHTLLILVIAP